MDKKELEEIAGEYVLGTLSHKEWLDAQARIKTDPDFALMVSEWEHKLAPLDVKDDDVAPPLGTWHKLSDKLDQIPSQSRETASSASSSVSSVSSVSSSDEGGKDNLIVLKRSRNRWRGAFAGALALAAGFIGLQALGIYLPYFPKPAAEGRFVAVLNPSGSTPGFLIRVDVGAKRLDIERLTGKAPDGKDYELWLIEPEQSPRSLDIVGRNSLQQVNLARLDGESPDGGSPVTFAITLEPEGGSPTDKPTGPIVFSGQLIGQ